MAKSFLKMLFFSLLFVSGRICFAQEIPPLEPISKHYKTLSELSAERDQSRVEMDTVELPWTEYSTMSFMTKMRLMYLSPEDSEKLYTLIHFPANSSDQTLAELNYLLDLQKTRTKEQIARSEVIANIAPSPNINPNDTNYYQNRKQLFFIATSVGTWFNSQNFPATTQLLMNCLADIRLTEFFLKRHFKRSRPYQLEPRLNPLTKNLSPSFPSGQTLWAYADAYVFGDIIPEKRETFLRTADEVRWSREIMGIHFPSDNEASRVVAWYLLKFWYHNPQFVTDVEKAKKEWQAKKDKFE
jgi:acid phosphatase (class A)